MSENGKLNKVVKFRLGNEYFAISVEDVKEVVKMQSITRTPNSPPHVDGIIDLRGVVCTIIDPKKLLDITEGGSTGRERIIVLDMSDSSVGIKVDEVLSVDDFSKDDLETNVELGEYAKGIIKDEIDGSLELIIWLDVEKLVTTKIHQLA
ncbi:MAG TPA: purine-binding chemotaxis protein CheW [Archaeoglobaceae archaeon]|nr:purine-binding chemotaxis protein CheW [Archaeoglobaceae archaeon]